MKILTPPLTPPLRWEGMAYGVAPIRLTRENEGEAYMLAQLIPSHRRGGVRGGVSNQRRNVHAGAANPEPGVGSVTKIQ
jgi:hypothetical protein